MRQHSKLSLWREQQWVSARALRCSLVHGPVLQTAGNDQVVEGDITVEEVERKVGWVVIGVG